MKNSQVSDTLFCKDLNLIMCSFFFTPHFSCLITTHFPPAGSSLEYTFKYIPCFNFPKVSTAVVQAWWTNHEHPSCRCCGCQAVLSCTDSSFLLYMWAPSISFFNRTKSSEWNRKKIMCSVPRFWHRLHHHSYLATVSISSCQFPSVIM